MKYYSIRIVEAQTHEAAVQRVENNEFEEEDGICDCVLTHEELVKELLERSLKCIK